MEKFKCPNGETIITIEDIRTRCVTRCGYEQFLKCLKEAEEGRTDEFVVQPFIISPDLLGVCERSQKCWD